MKTRIEFLSFFFFFLLLLSAMLQRVYPNPRGAVWCDAEGYYKYLPGLFIIKNFHQLDAGSVWPYYNDKGEYVDKYTCGVAYFELPAFLVAHALCLLKRGIFQ
jgi:hypothetical protein